MKKTLLLTCLAVNLSITEAANRLDEVTVTGTREAERLAETPASVGTLSEQAIRLVAPTHPQQILGEIPGVAVGVTNGEGHTTAIRQPFTTSPVYLFLEDGVPVRATGFFNHNALYEVNIPDASGIEVVRGPGTALYGSDAIGGIVNILTKAPAAAPEARLSAEGGNYRWDYTPSGDALFKTILGVTRSDQQTGANAPLIYRDYIDNPTKNNFTIAYRKVEALRLSTNYDKQLDAQPLLSLTPYLRKNYMDLNGTFNLSFDPRIEKTDVWAYGLMAKWRRDFPVTLRVRLILGIDIDYSHGTRTEDNLLVSTTGSGAGRSYNIYRSGSRIYDYEVTYQSLSPYVHTEISPSERLRVTAGLRYDHLDYDMSNDLAAGAVAANVNGATRYYYQLSDASADFSHLSPKFGLTYALSSAAYLYASYNHGFRAPSESQLFRAGNDGTPANAQIKAEEALTLRPIKAKQHELGVRGDAAGWRYDAVAYVLTKEDDLVSQRDLATNVTVNVNAGKTEHKGIELGLGKSFSRQWRFDTAVSYAKHTYLEWVTSTANFSGMEIEAAPRWIATTRLTWTPRTTSAVQMEWVKIGAYWLEAGNSSAFGKYNGYDLYNLRVNHELTQGWSLFARVMNLTDERYADSASVSSNTTVYSPGLPRSYYAGVEYRL